MTIAAPPEQLSDAARSFLQNAHHDLIIGAERPGAADGRTFETLDPATGEPIAVVAHAGAEDVDRAVRAARAAFEEGPWASMSAADRGALIERPPPPGPGDAPARAPPGIPEGVLNVSTGDGETGAALVDHPDVDKIAFTGSTVVGREIGAKAGAALKRVTLELGGKSPNIILPDADLDAAVKGSWTAIYFNSGQACNAGSRLFVPKENFDDVVAALAERAAGAKVGPGLDQATQVGPLVSAEQLERVTGYIESGRSEGAEPVTGGDAPDGGGYYVSPTLFTSTSDDLKIAREEIFGPVLVALPYETLDEVAARANDTEYGLAAGVWTRSLSNAHRLAARLKAGSIYINQWGMADASAPFGGYKASGVGREHGHAGLDAYLEVKTVWASLG